MSSTSNGKLSGPVILLGRILFSLVFLYFCIDQFNGRDLAYATAAHVPESKVLVPLAGVLILLGGLSILFGYKAKLGGWLIVLFLVPVTPVMHNFWAVTDPAMHAAQLQNFLRNTSMLGAALLITQFGAGPWSLDALSGAKRSPSARASVATSAR
ncbi:MAG: DoxX family protein [Candidatus Acidiferrales bacterium]